MLWRLAGMMAAGLFVQLAAEEVYVFVTADPSMGLTVHTGVVRVRTRKFDSKIVASRYESSLRSRFGNDWYAYYHHMRIHGPFSSPDPHDDRARSRVGSRSFPQSRFRPPSPNRRSGDRCRPPG